MRCIRGSGRDEGGGEDGREQTNAATANIEARMFSIAFLLRKVHVPFVETALRKAGSVTQQYPVYTCTQWLCIILKVGSERHDGVYNICSVHTAGVWRRRVRGTWGPRHWP